MKRKRNEEGPSAADVETPQRKDPSPSTFSQFGLDARLLQALAQEGFSTPTLVQAKAIPLALEGKDVLARAQTGSGKTIAYLLPVLHSILRRKADDPTARAGISAIILVPTRELAQQVSQVVTGLCAYCTKVIRSANLSQYASEAVQRSQLAESPDILIATPGRLAQNLNRPELELDGLTHFIFDEADLVLSYGYEEDLQALAKTVPKGVQMMMMSATLSTDIDTLNGLFCRDPAILELDEKDDDEGDRLSQYVVKCAEEEKFLLTYVIFKLKLLKGKCIIFVSDTNRSYRLKLFLEQFGIKSCILNSELPVNSRIHVVQEFNKHVYDIIIATDEPEVTEKRVKSKKSSSDETRDIPSEQVDSSTIAVSAQKPDSTEEQQDDLAQQGSEEEEEDETAPTAAPAKPTSKKRQRSKKAKEFGVSRGIDFKNVACVLNFDLPPSSKAYTHRIGRTARAGNSGTALSFVIPTELYRKHKSTSHPSAINDEAVLAQITRHQRKKRRDGKDAIQPYSFDMKQVEPFRYRMTDALSAVTRLAIREARTRELRKELLNSEKLTRYFEENPDDLSHLQRHDAESHALRVQPHLKNIPDYLMPARAGTGTEAGIGKEIGYVSFRKENDDKRNRKGRMLHGRRNNRGGVGGRKSKGVNNPLQSFKIGNRRK